MGDSNIEITAVCLMGKPDIRLRTNKRPFIDSFLFIVKSLAQGQLDLLTSDAHKSNLLVFELATQFQNLQMT